MGGPERLNSLSTENISTWTDPPLYFSKNIFKKSLLENAGQLAGLDRMNVQALLHSAREIPSRARKIPASSGASHNKRGGD